MLPGDFFLAPIQGAVGRGIAIGQWANGEGFKKIQHAGIYYGNGYTVEAMPGGAIMGHLDTYREEDLIWSSNAFDLTQKQRDAICMAAKGYLKTPYSFLDYDALAARRFHIPVPGLEDYIKATGHMICSQLVDQCYIDADVQIFHDGRWQGYVTPASLDNEIKARLAYRMSQGI
jgi:hypothetical protein